MHSRISVVHSKSKMSSSSTTTTATTTTVTSGGTTGIMSSGSGATPPAGTLPPVDISADRFAQLMAAITGTQVRLDDKLAEFKVEIAESQERAATSAARKVQANKESYVFKKKSHEEQHKANVNIDELEFWDNCLARYKAQPIWRAPSAVGVVYSDASETGYGGYTVEHGPHIAHGQWSITEMQQSSTWRELAAVLRVLGAIVGKLSNMRVRWFTDNQNVAHILKVGSKQQHLQTMALEVFFLTIQNHIHLEPEWIPRELNTQADYLSRIIDYDDWQLNHRVFSDLDRLWGPHTVDRFASNDNTQIERFNSRCWCPGTEAVDAFTVHWAGENNWLCPPITLVARVIRHAQVCQAEGTLIVPAWPSASFWPLLCPEGQCFASFVLQALELPSMHQLFVPCRSGAVLFGGGIPNTAVYALRCKF